MNEEIGTLFLGRQPIIDRNEQLAGYELLYRNSDGTSSMTSEQYATANVLTHTLNLSGLENITGNSLAFINIDGSFLQHDMILSVPKDSFVFEFHPSLLHNEENIQRLKELVSQGLMFTFTLDEIDGEILALITKVIDYIRYIKVNTMEVERNEVLQLIELISSNKKQLVATHVESKGIFNAFYELGFDFFQGYYFCEPEIIESTQMSADTSILLSLSNLLTTDASTKEITDAFEKAPTLVIQLLRYLNSGTFHFKTRINSIEQLITLLGRKALSQWLFLSLYGSNSESSQDNPLLKTIKQRTQMIADLLFMVKPAANKDEISKAYFVGLLSAIDVVCKQPMSVLFEKLQLDDIIKNALLEKSGLLGEIYEVSLAVEQQDLAKAEAFMFEHDISSAEFEVFLFKSFENATQFKPNA